MAELNLIKVDAKPIEKLIDVISKGIGTIYRPKAIRKEADAKAYEIEIIERAKAKALAEGREIEAESFDKIQDRLLHKETRRQENIDNVSQIAAEQLSQEQSVSEEHVDEDWTTRFFNIVEDISDEEMQQLWGRILAGEVKQPKSYSLRTLELLKNLSKKEAEVFTKASNFVIISNNSPFIFKGDDNRILDKYGLSFEDRLLLTEVGIIQSEANIIRRLFQNENDTYTYYESGKYLIRSLKKANTPECNFGVLRFTKIGEELLKLLIIKENESFVKDFSNKLISLGLDVDYVYILKKNSEQYIHTQPWLKFQ